MDRRADRAADVSMVGRTSTSAPDEVWGYSLENASKPLIPKVRESGIFLLPSEAGVSSLTAVSGLYVLSPAYEHPVWIC